MVDYCKIVGVEGEKCQKLREFLKDSCKPSKPKEPTLWKGRDLIAEWKEMYKRLTGG